MKKTRQTTKRPIRLLVTTWVLVVFLCVSGLSIPVIANDETISLANASSQYGEQTLERVPLFLKEEVNLDETKVKGIDISREEDPYSFTTINVDGTKTLYSFAAPIKYEGESGTMRYIDNSLVPSAKRTNKNDTYAFENKDSNTKAYFPKTIDDGILVTHEEYSIEFKPLPDKSAVKSFNGRSSVKKLKEENTVYNQYDNVFSKGYTLQYAPINGGIKENIVIDEYTGINTFSFKVTAPGLKPVIIKGQSVIFLDKKGETIFTIGQTFAVDSYEGEDDENRHITFDNYYTVEEISDGVYRIVTTVDEEFLQNANTVYPVTVDPGAWVTRDNMEDCTNYNYSGFPSNTYMTVGNLNGYEYASYVRINSLQNYTYINPANVTGAWYCARVTTTTNTDPVTISIYDAWGFQDLSIQSICDLGLIGLRGHKSGAAQTTQTVSTVSASDPTFYFDLTALAITWLRTELGESTYPSKRGFILDTANQTKSKQFKSSKWGDDASYFKIEYNDDVSIESGTYFVRRAGLGDYLYMGFSNPVSGNYVMRYPFIGNPQQQWTVTHKGGGLYELVTNANTNLALNNAGSSITVATKSAVNSQRWRLIRNGDGTYRIMSASDINKCASIVTSTDRVIPDEYGSYSTQKWEFERATTGVGGAIGYKSTSRTDIRCYQYATTLKIPEIYISFSIGDSVQTIRDRTLAAVQARGKHIRVITQNDLIHPTREYRVALRVASTDYHFMLQLSDGTWAHKRGQTASTQLGAINPTTLAWSWSGGPNYNSETIYFAVQAESSSFSW
ncbi:MAG: hypothetical protein BGN88_06360 [Clostridiales bacterium 43-6]|nr:MAG: hypothetical protein BGN88_06360 [Clostridiales bacterium 43-6]